MSIEHFELYWQQILAWANGIYVWLNRIQIGPLVLFDWIVLLSAVSLIFSSISSVAGAGTVTLGMGLGRFETVRKNARREARDAERYNGEKRGGK